MCRVSQTTETHRSWSIKRFYSDELWPYVYYSAKFEAVCGVGYPYFLAPIHGCPHAVTLGGSQTLPEGGKVGQWEGSGRMDKPAIKQNTAACHSLYQFNFAK